ncbi:ABC transporter permease [Bacteroidota bacterium]
MMIYKGFFLINIGGLVLGITSFLLISVWVLDELSYDRFYKNASCLYRVEQHVKDSYGEAHLALTPTPLAQILKDRFPDIVESCRINYMPDLLFSNENIEFMENRIMAATIPI